MLPSPFKLGGRLYWREDAVDQTIEQLLAPADDKDDGLAIKNRRAVSLVRRRA